MWLSELAREPERSVARWQTRLTEKPARLAPWLAALESLDTEAALEHATRHGSTPEGFIRHLTQWFDGFRTLKFVHLMRERHYPSMGLSTLLRQPATEQVLPALPALPTDEAAQLQWLQHSNAALADRLFT